MHRRERKVQRAVAQQWCDAGIEPVAAVNADLWVLLGELLQGRWQQTEPDGGRDGHLHRALPMAAQLSDLVTGALVLRDDQFGMLEQRLAKSREAGALLGAHQERCLQLGFELLDGCRQCGLRDVHPLCCGAQAAVFFDQDQCLQCREFHGVCADISEIDRTREKVNFQPNGRSLPCLVISVA